MTDLQTRSAADDSIDPPEGEQAPSGDVGSADTPKPGQRTINIPDVPVARILGVALVGVGGLLVLFFLYLLFFTPTTAGRDQARLSQSLVGHPLNVFNLVNGQIPAEGSPVAVLHIPQLNVDQIVVSGTSAADLMNGPGLMPGTALPGTVGNSVIAARRVTFGGPFGGLGSLTRGDKVQVTDGAGTFTYKVVKNVQVAAGQQDVIAPSLNNRLTLVTANSSWLPSGREVVVALLVGRAFTIPGVTQTLPTYETGLSGDPVAGGLALLWSLLTVIVLMVAVYVAWRWRRFLWLIYFFTAPTVMFFGLFACAAVARAIPATY